MNTISIAILAGLLLAVVSLPRRWALAAMMAGVLYLGQGQSFLLADVNIYPTRLLAIACLFRACLRNELTEVRWGRVDYLVFTLYAYVFAVHCVAPETRTVVLARCVEAVVQYVAFRGLFRELEDLRWFMATLVVLLVPYVLFLAMESITLNNPLAAVGGGDMNWLREGKRRCFGSFRHPSLLGSLGAVFLPVYIGMAADGSRRKLAVLGAILCVAIVAFANSGGPVMAVAAGLLGWGLWKSRKQMRLFRRGVFWGIVGLALVMKAPIWYLPARISAITGGGGYHRSRLMDVAFQNLSEWWLCGMPIESTRKWFPYVLEATGGADITNQFVAFGVSAGLGAVVLSIMLLVAVFSQTGRVLEYIRSRSRENHLDEWFVWGVGVTFSVHIVNWLSITYFDQFSTVWMFHLAAAATIIQGARTAMSGLATPHPLMSCSPTKNHNNGVCKPSERPCVV